MKRVIRRSTNIIHQRLFCVQRRFFIDEGLTPKKGISCQDGAQSSANNISNHANSQYPSVEKDLFNQIPGKREFTQRQPHTPTDNDQVKEATLKSEPAKQSTPQKLEPVNLPKTEKRLEEVKEIPKGERAILKKKFSLKEFLVEEWHKFKQSMKQLKTDSFRLYLYMLTKPGKRSYTLGEYLDKQKIKLDLLRFIPYGILIIVPGGELLIPFYIGLFPNAIPSQFLNEKSIGRKNEKKEIMQKEAFECLYKKIRSFFHSQFEEIEQLQREIKADPFNLDLLHRIAEIDSEISKELIENWHKYQKKLKFSNLSIDEIDYVLKFLFFDYVKGVHIINILLNLHKKIYNGISTGVFKQKSPRFKMSRYTFNIFPLNIMRKYFLRFQLNRQFKRLDFEDRLVELHTKSLEQLSSTEIYEFSRERGVTVQQDHDRIEYHQRVWMRDAAKTKKLELRFWVMLVRFSYGKHLV